jgi:hypothetical protein
MSAKNSAAANLNANSNMHMQHLHNKLGEEKNIEFLSPKCHHHEGPQCPIPTHILFCIFMKVRAGHRRSTKRALDFRPPAT